MTKPRVEAAFATTVALSAEEGEPTEYMHMGTQLPYGLALLGLQWRPRWAKALVDGGLFALREKVIEERKRWLRIFFGNTSINGFLQLLEGTCIASAHLSKQLVAFAEVEERDVVSPLGQATEAVTDKHGSLSPKGFASIVCILVRLQAFSKFQPQWDLTSRPAVASQLTSPVQRIFGARSPPHFSFASAAAEGSPVGLHSPPAIPAKARQSRAGAAVPATAGSARATHEVALVTRGGPSPEHASSDVSVGGGQRPHGLVFLGGACGPTTWRKDIAIPALVEAGIPFFNPQVEEWSAELVDVEAQKKAEAGTLLFVISDRTRSIASMVEAAEHITRGKCSVVLVVSQIPASAVGHGLQEEPAEIPAASLPPLPGHRKVSSGSPPDLQGLTASEWKDLNRGRTYLRDIAERRDLCVFDTTEAAVQHIVLNYDRGNAAVPGVAAGAPPVRGDQVSRLCHSAHS